MEPKSNQPSGGVAVGGFFAVSPKNDCPHEASLNLGGILTNLINRDLKTASCADCDVTKENWMCLECYSVGCSRYFNSHMSKHAQATGHRIALSFSDASIWCYDCDSYITSNQLNLLTREFSQMKFPEEGNKGAVEVDALSAEFSKLSTQPKQEKEKKVFTRQELIDGLKNKTFKKVVLLTGAGISVSAGIPDFRSPGTGLYDNLATYNLPYPEAVFDIKYFRVKPEPFYKLSKELLKNKANPVVSHHFIKILDDEGLLFLNMTQNIDGLEVAAGVDPEKVVEAHGSYRTARCIKCNKPQSVDEFMKHMEEEKVYKCECGGIVKPDITFFGEALPERFFTSSEKISEADLAIIIGTSLKVTPFSLLPDQFDETTPMVYINRENNKIFRDNFLFMEGDIDEQMNQLIKDIGWEEKLEKVKSKKE